MIQWDKSSTKRSTAVSRFTRLALFHRAADYFEQTRTPSESWRGIDDLAPQLAEFELRVAGAEYDAAASVLLDIDFDYLMLWGHSRLTVELHERLQGRLSDRDLIRASRGNLGVCYYRLGDYPRAIDHHQQCLAIAREMGAAYTEAAVLTYLADVYRDTGQGGRAMNRYQDAMRLADATGNA